MRLTSKIIYLNSAVKKINFVLKIVLKYTKIKLCQGHCNTFINRAFKRKSILSNLALLKNIFEMPKRKASIGRLSTTSKRKQKSRELNQNPNTEEHSYILSKEAFNYKYNADYKSDSNVNIGLMNVLCNYCGAQSFKNETVGLCCKSGKIRLPQLEVPPNPLYSLIFDSTPQSKQFLPNVRKYNGCFQMTSFGAKNVLGDGFVSTFKIQGQVYHRIGSLLPTVDNDANFLQIYFIGDPELEISRRCDVFPGVKRDIPANTVMSNEHQVDILPRILEYPFFLKRTSI